MGVQEVVKQIAAPPPIVQAPVMGAPVVETFGAAPFMGAPVVETSGASTFAPTLATAPLVGSISAGLPMTTMAAPTMTTMGAPVGAFGSPLVGTSYGLPPTVF